MLLKCTVEMFEHFLLLNIFCVCSLKFYMCEGTAKFVLRKSLWSRQRTNFVVLQAHGNVFVTATYF